MYAAGLTVREIADRCQKKRNTVHLHLQVREQHQPGLCAKHDAAFAVRGPDRPTTGWRRKLTEARDFYGAYGRLPHHDGDPVEKSLHIWVSVQRRANQRGDLALPKIVLLDSLPGWKEVTRQQELDEQWHTRLTELEDYVASTGQLPRYRKFATEHEHILGVWLHVQHQKRAQNTLQPCRLEFLNTALPGWRSHT